MAQRSELTGWQWKKYHEDTKLFNSLVGCKYYCKCGHSVIMTASTDVMICDHCHHTLFKDKQKQREYDEKMRKREELLKFKKELRERLW